MLTLADPIEHARSCFGERIAVIDGERAFTYAEAVSACADRFDLFFWGPAE